MTVESIFEKSNFLIMSKTGRMYKSVRAIEVSAMNLEDAIVAAKCDKKDFLEACVLTEFGWLLIPSTESLEALYAAS